MKISSVLRIVPVVALAVLAGCSAPSKKYGTGNPGDLEPLPGNPEALSGTGIPEARPEGINPDTDVDYNQLAQYTVYFAYDSSTIQPSERAKLASIADWLKQNAGKRLYLAGHADARGTPEYNRGLGERRAQATREYLVGLGIEATRLFTISYGSDRPAVEGSTEEAYAKNRRVAPGVITK